MRWLRRLNTGGSGGTLLHDAAKNQSARSTVSLHLKEAHIGF